MPIFTLNPSSSNNNRKKLRLEREIHFTGVGRILGTAEEVGARKRKVSFISIRSHSNPIHCSSAACMYVCMLVCTQKVIES